MQSTTGPGRMVYRAMREDSAGGPATGPTGRTLGVRPGDILVTAGFVQPSSGGMSVAPDRPANLPLIRRPIQLGGLGKDPVWFLALADLPSELQFRQDSAAHGLIEPRTMMTIDEFQRLLSATKANWRRLP